METFPEVFISSLCCHRLQQLVLSSINLDDTNISFIPLSPINNKAEETQYNKHFWVLVDSDRSPSNMEPIEFSCPE